MLCIEQAPNTNGRWRLRAAAAAYGSMMRVLFEVELRFRAFVVVAIACSCVPLAAQIGEGPRTPAVIAEQWPGPETMQAQRIDAEARRLFAGTDVFALTLSADLKALNRDRSVEGRKTYRATLTVTDAAGTSILHVSLRTRGHFRLRASVCSFAPLRIEFTPGQVTGTIFEGQTALKLVTHCQNDKAFEQFTLGEYLAYRALNILTPRSFRARLARVTYLQSNSATPITTRFGVFLEDDDDVARRMEGRIVDLPRATFKDVDQDALTLMMMFEYMIGNTDFSLYARHNIRFVRTRSNTTYAIPYDFDLSGLVNASYAIPHRSLRIETVRDRLYRGPCRPLEKVDPILQQFRAHKAEVLALYDSQPEFDGEYRRNARVYLDEFFRMIDRTGDVRKTFVDGRCSTKPTM